MRLLSVSDLQIVSNFDDAATGISNAAQAQAQLWDMKPSVAKYAIPPYAILSHRWVGDEVIFQNFESVDKLDFQKLPSSNPVKQQTGPVENTGTGLDASIYKIAGACEQVRAGNPGVRHIWIDTVCFNKSDGREYTSAINSMFKYYNSATVCYVYLFDVTWNQTADPVRSKEQFLQSQWFTRGWTLQELLAPKNLEFFHRDWKHIGSKQDMADSITQATGISREHLMGDFRTASTAQKMSWLSRRTTTIIEDRAYCMLGLFDVFLDARYGQGAKEFLRLQREIFTSSYAAGIFDESLFAWSSDLVASSGLLAPAPSCFRNSAHIVFDPRLAKSRKMQGSSRVVFTKPGMDIDANYAVDFHVPSVVSTNGAAVNAAHMLTFGTVSAATLAFSSANRRRKDDHLVNLNCWVRSPAGKMRTVRIKMKQEKDKTWRRVDCGTLFESDCSNVYSQSDVHGRNGRVFVPNEVVYKS